MSLFSFSMQLQQNLTLRMTLVQKLGLDSRFLQTCLVRSEEMLKELRFQAPLRLVRRFDDEDNYHSVLDFLVGLFVPALKPRIFAYYNQCGPRLIAQSNWNDIDRLDRMMVTALTDLRALYDEVRSAAWRVGRGDFTVPELTGAWLDLHVRPRFNVPKLIEAEDNAEQRSAA